MRNEKATSQIVFGRHPVEELIKSGQSVEKVMIQQGVRGEFEKTIRHLCREHHVPLQVVPKIKLDKSVRGNHQGIVALMAPIQYEKLENVVPWLLEQGETPLLILLDGVTDIRNVGAIARSAEVFGVHAVVLSAKNSAPVNADAIKASAGAIARLKICREKSLLAAVEYLAQSGVYVVASDLKADKKLSEVDFKVPVAIVMGSENTGVHPNILQMADSTFIIPQAGQIDSLNVSVATGVVLYEACKQRLEK